MTTIWYVLRSTQPGLLLPGRPPAAANEPLTAAPGGSGSGGRGGGGGGPLPDEKAVFDRPSFRKKKAKIARSSTGRKPAS
jgi:hypothetical protein